MKKTETGVKLYDVAMKEVKPQTDIECVMQAGNVYFLDTALCLKGQGIKCLKQYESKDFHKTNQYKVGWYSYKVTKRAYEKLCQQYSIAKEVYTN